jgi:hypothetical protein
MDLVDDFNYLGPWAFPEDPDAPGPCSCCWAANAMWAIEGGQVWLCGVKQVYWGVPATWADEMDWDEAQRVAALSAEQRARELAARAASAAAQMAELDRHAEVSAISRAAEAYAARVSRLVEDRAPRGPPLPRGAPPRGPPKRNCPCKNLFYDEKQVRPGQRAPFVKYVASECWAYEYTDPKTGEKKAPHKCPYLHPGEVGWLPQWNRDRDFKPRPAGPAAAPAPRGGAGGDRRPASRWSLGDSDEDD